MRWFRMYIDILTDEKIREMSLKTFKIFTFLMALVSELETKGTLKNDLKFLSWRLGFSKNTIKKALLELEQLEIINAASDFISIINWNKRQYKSDNSTYRVQKYRNKQGNVSSNVSETENVTSPEYRVQSTDKQNKEKENKKKTHSKFKKPTKEEVRQYAKKIGYQELIDYPELFIDKQESIGWVVGRNKSPMKNWQRAINTWFTNSKKRQNNNGTLKTDPIVNINNENDKYFEEMLNGK